MFIVLVLGEKSMTPGDRPLPRLVIARSGLCDEAISITKVRDCFAEFTLSEANVLAMTDLWVIARMMRVTADDDTVMLTA